MKQKYNARKVVYNGVTFDSKGEFTRYRVLSSMEEAGEITKLRLQPRFLLQEKFTDSDGNKVRAMHFTADFKYEINGEVIIEDFKSTATAKKTDYIMRKKMFKFKYPQYKFRESFR